METKLRVALVDDHTVVREGFKALLNASGKFEVVSEARNAEMALELVDKHPIDVLISDISMPTMSGIDLCYKLKTEKPELPVIMLSMHNNKEYLINAYRAGASGYLVKDCDKDELYFALKKVAKGGRYFGDSITHSMMDKLIETNNEPQKRFNNLTKRELEILNLLLEGYNTKQIAEKLFISFRTVDKHRSNMMEKIEVHNVVDLINYVRENRLIQE
jgi:DNA-binding NarL/FixJ family response regulator